MGVLDRVENPIDPCSARGVDEATRRLGNGLESLHHRHGVLAQVLKQHIATCQVLGLGQRTKYRLEQGRPRIQALADDAKTFQLLSEMGRRRIEFRQGRPIAGI